MITKSFFNEVTANDLAYYVFGNLVECTLPQKCAVYGRLSNQLNQLETSHLFIDVTKDGLVYACDDIDLFRSMHNSLDSMVVLDSHYVFDSDGYSKLEICLNKY